MKKRIIIVAIIAVLLLLPGCRRVSFESSKNLAGDGTNAVGTTIPAVVKADISNPATTTSTTNTLSNIEEVTVKNTFTVITEETLADTVITNSELPVQQNNNVSSGSFNTVDNQYKVYILNGINSIRTQKSLTEMTNYMPLADTAQSAANKMASEDIESVGNYSDYTVITGEISLLKEAQCNRAGISYIEGNTALQSTQTNIGIGIASSSTGKNYVCIIIPK